MTRITFAPLPTESKDGGASSGASRPTFGGVGQNDGRANTASTDAATTRSNALFGGGFTSGLQSSQSTSEKNKLNKNTNKTVFSTSIRKEEHCMNTSSAEDGSAPAASHSCSASAIVWDPKLPEALSIVSGLNVALNDDTSTNTAAADSHHPSGLTLQLSTKLVQEGVIGMTDFEIKALIEMLNARTQFQEWFLNSEGVISTDDLIEKLQSLSRTYRQALIECLDAWSDDIETNRDETSPLVEEETAAVDCLRLMVSVIHLSEIYFLSYPAMMMISSSAATSSDIPGSLTAETVRYLRFNIMPDKFVTTQQYNTTNDDSYYDAFEEMIQSDRPECWGVPDEDVDNNDAESSSPSRSSSVKTLYWRQVRALVARGCLREGWNLLMRHSLYDDSPPQEVQAGFAQLRAIMLSAPIPGGIVDTYDDGMYDQHKGAEEEAKKSRSILNEDDDDYDMSDDGEEGENSLLLNIRRDAHKGWDRDRNFNRRGVSMDVAKNDWNTWSNYVQGVTREGGGNTMKGLLRYIPSLKWAVLDVLTGEAPIDSYNDWAEAFCATLLYQQPQLTTESIPFKMDAILRRYQDDNNEVIRGVVLPVMRKNAGDAILKLHCIGGGSGAALPATVTALICDMLVLSRHIPVLMEDANNNNAKVNFRRELLLVAASTCRSAFDELDQGIVGVEQAYKLYQIDGSSRAKEACHDMMCRQTPNSVSEAKLLLKLCNSQPYLYDAGCTVALCQARRYLNESRPGGFMSWSLRGVEFESKSSSGRQSTITTTAKGRASAGIRAYCTDLSLDILKSLLFKDLDDDSSHNLKPLLLSANEVLNVATNDDALSNTSIINGLLSTSLTLLRHVMELDSTEASSGTITNKSLPQLISEVVMCLSTNEVEGVEVTLAHSSIWPFLLVFALKVMKQIKEEEEQEKIKEEEEQETIELKPAASTFSVAGINILMERFETLIQEHDGLTSVAGRAMSIVEKLYALVMSQQGENMDSSHNNGSTRAIRQEIRLLFGTALMRACEQESSMKQWKVEQDFIKQTKEESNRRAPPLVGGIEEAIELVLGPSPCMI